MFSQDQPTIGQYAQSGPDAMAEVALFVVSTIRMNFTRVKAICESHDYSHSLPSVVSAAGFINENRVSLYNATMRALKKSGSQMKARALIHLWSTVPGIGIIKAGFICQLVAGVGGCIDVHNARRYGINLDAFRIQKGLSDKVVNLKIGHYVRMTHQIGSANLWDNWCHHMANKYPMHWTTGDKVSKYHLECLNLTA